MIGLWHAPHSNQNMQASKEALNFTMAPLGIGFPLKQKVFEGVEQIG